MIGRLSGNYVELTDEGSVILDVGGVGYELFVPLGTMGRVPSEGPVTLHVHTHVREDALILYGFATEDDRRAFRALLTVSSVGPKLAIAILGRLEAGALAEAIARENKAALKGISGVGTKTVERIMLDLKGKLPVGASSRVDAPAAPPRQASGFETVLGALVGMGYKRAEAERALESLPESSASLPADLLLREALGALR